MIEVRGVGHRIAGQDILKDITVQIPSGGVTALIGPNGAGKSTLLSLISRLMPLQQGVISVNGSPLHRTSSDQLARLLAVLPQASEIAPRLSVAQLVRFGRYPHSKGRPTKICIAKIEQAIARFELEHFKDRMIDTLSGGQRQRALLAMAYAQDTDYLLLDEPLNNLDIAAARHLMKLLRNMAKTEEKTILIVLHDINYASAYADRIIALRAGRIVANGSPQNVITEETLVDVFGTEAPVISVQGAPLVLV